MTVTICQVSAVSRLKALCLALPIILANQEELMEKMEKIMPKFMKSGKICLPMGMERIVDEKFVNNVIDDMSPSQVKASDSSSTFKSMETWSKYIDKELGHLGFADEQARNVFFDCLGATSSSWNSSEERSKISYLIKNLTSKMRQAAHLYEGVHDSSVSSKAFEHLSSSMRLQDQIPELLLGFLRDARILDKKAMNKMCVAEKGCKAFVITEFDLVGVPGDPHCRIPGVHQGYLCSTQVSEDKFPLFRKIYQDHVIEGTIGNFLSSKPLNMRVEFGYANIDYEGTQEYSADLPPPKMASPCDGAKNCNINGGVKVQQQIASNSDNVNFGQQQQKPCEGSGNRAAAGAAQSVCCESDGTVCCMGSAVSASATKVKSSRCPSHHPFKQKPAQLWERASPVIPEAHVGDAYLKFAAGCCGFLLSGALVMRYRLGIRQNLYNSLNPVSHQLPDDAA